MLPSDRRKTKCLLLSNVMFAGFCYHLVKLELWTTEQLLNVIEKPWDFTDEFNAWITSGYLKFT